MARRGSKTMRMVMRASAPWFLAAVCGCALPGRSPALMCDLTPTPLDEPVAAERTVVAVPEPSPAGAPAAEIGERVPERRVKRGVLGSSAASRVPVPAAESAAPADVSPADEGSSAPRAAASDATGGGKDYRVQPLDSLRVDVFGEPDISGVFPVSAEGAVRHPLLESVPVAGKLVSEVERQFVELLGARYLVNPRVSVRVEHSTGRRVTILGEIKKPGTYTLPPEQPLTLLGLVATAGGFTDISDPKRVRILRASTEGKDNTIRINVNDLLKGRLEQTDIQLLPGDVVMVPEAIF